MSTKLRFLVACSCLFALSGCVESEQPLSSVSSAEQDPRLYGLWVHRDGESAEFVVIGDEADPDPNSGRAAVEPGIMRYWSIEQQGETHTVAAPSGAQFFCTKVGSDDFATWITPADDKEPNKPASYFFLKYRVDEKRLTIWLQDPEKTAAAIEAGKLKGIVKRTTKKKFLNDDIETLRITDSSEKIRAFFADGGATSCFPDDNKLEYERVR